MNSNISQYRYNTFSLLFFLGTILPAFAVFPLAGVGFTLPKIVIFSCTGVLGMLWLLLRDDLAPLEIFRVHWCGRFILYFAIVLLLSITWSVVPVVSVIGAAPRFEGLLYYSVCFAFMLCALCLSQHPRGLRNCITAIIISNTGVVLYGLLQLCNLDPFALYWDDQAFLGRLFSLLGQPNALGSFLILTLPFVIIKGIGEKGKYRLLFQFMSIANFIVLMGTASRAAVLGLAVAFIVFSDGLFPTIKTAVHKMSGPQKAMLIFIISCIVIIGSFSFAKRFSLPSEQGRSWGTRQVVWVDALHMFAERPQGYGLDSFALVYPKFKSPQLRYTESLTATVDRAHNKPLDLVISLGLAGLITYYGFLITLLSTAWKKKRSHGVYLAGGIGVTAYSVSILFGFDTILTGVYFWIICGLMMGILWQGSHKKSKSASSLWKRIVVVVLCIFCAISTVVYTRWFHARTVMYQAERQFAAGQLSDSIRTYAEATVSFTYDRAILVRFIETALIGIEHTDDDHSKLALHNAVEHSLTTLALLAGDVDGMAPVMSAWNAALKKDTPSVEKNLYIAKQRMPRTVDIYRIAAHCYALLGDRKGVNSANAEIINLLPSYWKDRDSEQGRILWKENPWLKDILVQGMMREYTEWDL